MCLCACVCADYMSSAVGATNVIQATLRGLIRSVSVALLSSDCVSLPVMGSRRWEGRCERSSKYEEKGVSRRQCDKKEWGEEEEMRKRKCRGVELREEEQIG